MPAFDPVRDAVLNSPVDSPSRSPSLGRRPTDISVLLNDADHPPRHRPSSSIHSLLAPDDTLATAPPFRRASSSTTLSTPEQRPRSASTATFMTQALPPKPLPLPYNPTNRRTAPDLVLVPLSPEEMKLYRNFRGQGANRLVVKRKRASSDEPDPADIRTSKRHTGDVGVVVHHCQSYLLSFFFFSRFLLPSRKDNSRPDVGVIQRMGSPIIGLKAFNNWVKSVLITQFAHPALHKGSLAHGNKRGKVLDMGCGKGGDISKWAKSRAAEVFFIGKSYLVTFNPANPPKNQNRYRIRFCRSSKITLGNNESLALRGLLRDR